MSGVSSHRLRDPPQGDWGSVMLAVGADVEARGPDGTRTIPIEEFFKGPFTTALSYLHGSFAFDPDPGVPLSMNFDFSPTPRRRGGPRSALA